MTRYRQLTAKDSSAKRCPGCRKMFVPDDEWQNRCSERCEANIKRRERRGRGAARVSLGCFGTDFQPAIPPIASIRTSRGRSVLVVRTRKHRAARPAVERRTDAGLPVDREIMGGILGRTRTTPWDVLEDA